MPISFKRITELCQESSWNITIVFGFASKGISYPRERLLLPTKFFSAGKALAG